MYFLSSCSPGSQPLVDLQKGSRIALIGSNICARMLHYGYLETAFHLRYPDSLLFIRNLCDGGDMPGFRPHPARNTPWAFPGAEAYYEELANPSHSEGHFPYPDEWLDTLNAELTALQATGRALAALDVLCTEAVLLSGGIEVNPLAAGVHRAGALPAIAALGERIGRLGPETTMARLFEGLRTAGLAGS